MQFVDVYDLPKPLKDVLYKIGYKKKEIAIQSNDKVCLGTSSVLRYNRGFAAVIDLLNDKYRIGYGSYGGSNQHFRTIIDDCPYNFQFPAHVVVITGEQGANGNYATLTVNPESNLSFFKNAEPKEYRIYKVAKIYMTAFRVRKDELLKNEKIRVIDISDAVKASVLVENKNGLKITKRGKKFVKYFEMQHPDRKFLCA